VPFNLSLAALFLIEITLVVRLRDVEIICNWLGLVDLIGMYLGRVYVGY